MNYFHPEVQKILPFKNLKQKTFTNAYDNAVMTAIVVFVLSHCQAKKNPQKTKQQRQKTKQNTFSHL